MKFSNGVWLRFSIALCGLAIWVGLPAVPRCAAAEPVRHPENNHTLPPRILLIYSYTVEQVRFYGLSEGFFRELSTVRIPASLKIVELDAQRRPDPAEWEESLAPELPALKAGSYDVIVTFGTPALLALGPMAEQLNPSTALVYCGPGAVPQNLLRHHPNTTGILKNRGAGDTLRLGLKLFPDTRQVVLITNRTPEGKMVEADVKKILNGVMDVKLEVLTRETDFTESMLEKLATLPPDTLVLYNGWHDVRFETKDRQRETLFQISARAKAPILVLHDVDLAPGLLGGIVASGTADGKLAAQLVRKILSGTRAAALPAMTTRNFCRIQYPMLKHYQRDVSDLPPDAILDGRPVNFIEAHVRILLAGGVAALLAGGLLLLLALALWGRRRRERRQSELYTHLPLRFLVVDWNGRILDSNPGDLQFLSAEIRHPVNLRQIEEQSGDAMLEKVRGVLSSGRSLSLDFVFRGQPRTVNIARLPFELYRCEAAIWISQNTSELQYSKQRITELEEYLKSSLHAISEAVIVTDIDGCITMINTAACQMLVVDAAEVRGLPLNDVFSIAHAETNTPMSSPVQQACRKCSTVLLPSDTVLLLRSGARQPITGRVAPISTADEKILGTVLVFKICHHGEILATPEQSRQLLQAILDALPSGAAIESNGVLLMRNRSFAEHLPPGAGNSSPMPSAAAGLPELTDGEMSSYGMWAPSNAEAKPILLARHPLLLESGQRFILDLCKTQLVDPNSPECRRQLENIETQLHYEQACSKVWTLAFSSAEFDDTLQAALQAAAIPSGPNAVVIFGEYGPAGDSFSVRSIGSAKGTLPHEALEKLHKMVVETALRLLRERILPINGTDLPIFESPDYSGLLTTLSDGEKATRGLFMTLHPQADPHQRNMAIAALQTTAQRLKLLHAHRQRIQGIRRAGLERFQMFEQFPFPLWLYTPGGRLQRTNQVAAALGNWPETVGLIQDVLAGNQSVHREVQRDGCSFRLSVTPFRDAHGKIFNLMQCAIKLQEIAGLRDDIQTLREQLHRIRQNRRLLAVVLNNELRTPLNTLLGSAELLCRHVENTENMREYLENIQSAGQLLINLCSGIQDFDALESALCSSTLEVVETDKLAAEIIAELSGTPFSRAVALKLPADRLPCLRLEILPLRQLLHHLLISMISSANGPVELRLTFEESAASPETGRLTISASGNITGTRLAALFNRANQPLSNGSLNLAIVKILADRLNGGFMRGNTAVENASLLVTLDHVPIVSAPRMPAAPAGVSQSAQSDSHTS